MSTAADLGQLLQRRELAAYQRRMARASFAYGVDLRRSSWLSTSQVARPLVAGAARAWPKLVAHLERDVVAPVDRVPTRLLEEVAAAAERLSTRLPAVRVVRPGVPFAGALPLGSLHGSVEWLVVDTGALGELSEPARRFVLAQALGHLQCDHGILFTAHLAAQARLGLGWVVRRTLAPFVKVAPFSADRAAYLTEPDLDVAKTAISWVEERGRAAGFWPQFPPISLRLEALADFDRSVVVASVRRRLRGNDDSDDPSLRLAGWSLARCDARLTRRLGLP